jgi:hypothetical protein
VPLSQLNVNVNAKGIQRTKVIGKRGETAQTAPSFRCFFLLGYDTIPYASFLRLLPPIVVEGCTMMMMMMTT